MCLWWNLLIKSGWSVGVTILLPLPFSTPSTVVNLHNVFPPHLPIALPTLLSLCRFRIPTYSIWIALWLQEHRNAFHHGDLVFSSKRSPADQTLKNESKLQKAHAVWTMISNFWAASSNGVEVDGDWRICKLEVSCCSPRKCQYWQQSGCIRWIKVKGQLWTKQLQRSGNCPRGLNRWKEGGPCHEELEEHVTMPSCSFQVIFTMSWYGL